MIHTKTNVVSCLVGVSVLLSGCATEAIKPVDPPTKDPRDYTWTIDTLAYPGSLQTLMRAIWGSSSNNIYTCGHNDRGLGSMYQWGGQSWTNVRLLITEGGPLMSVGSFRAILGFSSQEIYAAGIAADRFSSFLIHFDGSVWREISVPGGRGLQSLWGRSSNDLWIGGLGGFLSQYNGSQFARDSVRYTFDTTGMDIQVSQITGSATTAHLVLAVAPDTLFAPIFYFYERAGSQWQIRDSSYEFARIFIDPAGTVYRYGYDGVQRRTGGAWETVLTGLTVGGNGMAGSSESSVFAVGVAGPSPHGRVYHYNGSDWYEFTQLRMDEVTFNSVWTDGKEAFVVGTTSGSPMKTVVLHGK